MDSKLLNFLSNSSQHEDAENLFDASNKLSEMDEVGITLDR